MIPCRFIFSQPAKGTWNMALDEALLASVAQATTDFDATLRIYRWSQPTLSLGYFQAAADRQLHEASRDCDLIRRSSGGGAILHDHELTYSLILPARIAASSPATQWYFAAHNALIAAIASLTSVQAKLCEKPARIPPREEPFLCFQRRAVGDVLLGNHKIAGSAQRRRGGAILQHGSVLLRCSAHASELSGISDLIAGEIEFDQLATSLSSEIASTLEFHLHHDTPTDKEQKLAERLQAEKYATNAWTVRR